MKPITTLRRGLDTGASLKSTHPAAAQWIGTLIRMTSAHPAMTRILEVFERLSERPYRTNFVLLGEPGTGKEGLGRALATLSSPGGPLIRYDVAGFPEEEALSVLCGAGRRGGVAEAADRGTILVEEAAGLPARVQAALLRLLKSGRCERRGAVAPEDEEQDGAPASGKVTPSGKARRFDVRIVAMSDRDLMAEVSAGRFRHDLYYRLARIQLTLPPLRERKEDIGPAVIWMGNRILREAGVPLELMGVADFDQAPRQERVRAIALEPEAVRALERHTWPGNFRELEAVLESALLLYREGNRLEPGDVLAALASAAAGASTPPSAAAW